MKWKKILTGTLAAAMLFSNASVANLTALAKETAVVSLESARETLGTLMNEAIEKVNIEKDGIKYSQASKDAVMVKYAAARKVKNNSGATEEQLEAAIKDLREALDNLEQLCKVTVDKRFTNDIKVTLTAEHAEYASENEDSAEFYVPLKEKVTVTTSEKDGNIPFSGWEMTVNNGGSSEDSGTKIVSNSTVYTFYVTGETHLEPVYGETDEKPAEEKIVLTCSTGYETDSAYFLTKREIPKKYSVVEHGVVMTDERGWERYQNKEEGFVRGAALTKRSVAKRKGNSGIFKAKLKCEKNKVWYGRAYIIYTDGETTYTKYSEIIRYPQQSLLPATSISLLSSLFPASFHGISLPAACVDSFQFQTLKYPIPRPSFFHVETISFSPSPRLKNPPAS